jgi:hypothetical protein
MEQPKGQQNHQEHGHQHDHARRDDLTWTQYITNLAANKLSQPKSATLKVLEQQLARLNEELVGAGESRIKDRTAEGDTSRDKLGLSSPMEESEPRGKGAQNGLAAGLNDLLAVNNDNGVVQGSASLVLANTDIDSFSFGDGRNVPRANPEVARLQQELVVGARWIDVLWQFIAAHQKRVLDLDRLGIEPSERVDLQVDMIRQIAASYEKLGLLTRLPDSLSEARECKLVDDIRTMALVYVARKMMDVASPEEISFEDDDTKDIEKKKQTLDFPRSVISPYEGIRPIEFDPLELLTAS